MITVENLTKTFPGSTGQVRALDGVNLDVAAGTVLDGASGFPVIATSQIQSAVSVIAGNTGYFATWSEGRPNEIRGARLSPSGTVLDPGGFLVTYASNNETNPAVAFDGANYLVVWQDNRNGDIDVKVNVTVNKASGSAKSKIEAAGGSVTEA